MSEPTNTNSETTVVTDNTGAAPGGVSNETVSPVASTPAEVTTTTEGKDGGKVATTQPAHDDLPSFDNFLAAKGEALAPEPNKKVADETKVATDDVVIADDKKEVTTAEHKGKASERDYTGFDDTEKKHFARMSNDAFNFIAPRYRQQKAMQTELETTKSKVKELSEGRVELPPNYYEHPQGFRLHPAYQEAEHLARAATFEQNHWEKQLIKMQGGEDWQDLDIDQKTGNYILSEDKPATKADLVRIQRYYNDATAIVREKLSEVKSFQNTFQQRNNQIKNIISDTEKMYFPIYSKDDKHSAWKEIKGVTSELEKVLPNNPLNKMLGMSYAFIRELQGQLAEKNKKIETKVAIADDTKRAGPTVGSFIASKTPNEVEPNISFDDFRRLKE
jgi:hypothetical protein